jgi:hypothetical protein
MKEKGVIFMMKQKLPILRGIFRLPGWQKEWPSAMAL